MGQPSGTTHVRTSHTTAMIMPTINVFLIALPQKARHRATLSSGVRFLSSSGSSIVSYLTTSQKSCKTVPISSNGQHLV